MKIPPLVTLDTNVIISSFLTPGKSRVIIDLASRRKILVFASPQLEEELRDTLKDKLKYDKDELFQALITYKEIIYKFVYPQRKLNIVVQDETDNRIIEVAIEGKVKYIISGDRHLLKLNRYKGINKFVSDEIKILSPSDFLESLKD